MSKKTVQINGESLQGGVQDNTTDLDREPLDQEEVDDTANDYNKQVVEKDPTGRYLRLNKIIGRGAFKTVYHGLDREEGREVAWNQVRMTELLQSGRGYQQDRDRLYGEVRVLKKLRHKNIMTFYDSWVDEQNQVINFVTELFTSGDLRQYRKRHKIVEAVALKKWAWQILQGLVYLHGHNPPIIHRDLKSDNVFVQGTTGTLKIGDLGLATLMRTSSATQSVLGTPEYMAPEFYEERYDQKVDIYSYGMCILELATMEYPYKECTNPAQIYKRVSQGIHPAALQKVQDADLRRFIELCICHNPQFRPEARELLKNSFFDEIKASWKVIGSEPLSLPCSPPQSGKQSPTLARARSDLGDHHICSEDEVVLENVSKTRPSSPREGRGIGDTPFAPLNGQLPHSPYIDQQQQINGSLQQSPSFQMYGGAELGELQSTEGLGIAGGDTTYQVKCRGFTGRIASFKLNLPRNQGEKRAVCFDFDVDEDTPERVAEEMIRELQLREKDTKVISNAVRSELQRLMPSMDSEVFDSAHSNFQRQHNNR